MMFESTVGSPNPLSVRGRLLNSTRQVRKRRQTISSKRASNTSTPSSSVKRKDSTLKSPRWSFRNAKSASYASLFEHPDAGSPLGSGRGRDRTPRTPPQTGVTDGWGPCSPEVLSGAFEEEALAISSIQTTMVGNRSLASGSYSVRNIDSSPPVAGVSPLLDAALAGPRRDARDQPVPPLEMKPSGPIRYRPTSVADLSEGSPNAFVDAVEEEGGSSSSGATTDDFSARGTAMPAQGTDPQNNDLENDGDDMSAEDDGNMSQCSSTSSWISLRIPTIRLERRKLKRKWSRRKSKSIKLLPRIIKSVEEIAEHPDIEIRTPERSVPLHMLSGEMPKLDAPGCPLREYLSPAPSPQEEREVCERRCEKNTSLEDSDICSVSDGLSAPKGDGCSRVNQRLTPRTCALHDAAHLELTPSCATSAKAQVATTTPPNRQNDSATTPEPQRPKPQQETHQISCDDAMAECAIPQSSRFISSGQSKQSNRSFSSPSAVHTGPISSPCFSKSQSNRTNQPFDTPSRGSPMATPARKEIFREGSRGGRFVTTPGRVGTDGSPEDESTAADEHSAASTDHVAGVDGSPRSQLFFTPDGKPASLAAVAETYNATPDISRPHSNENGENRVVPPLPCSCSIVSAIHDRKLKRSYQDDEGGSLAEGSVTSVASRAESIASGVVVIGPGGSMGGAGNDGAGSIMKGGDFEQNFMVVFDSKGPSDAGSATMPGSSREAKVDAVARATASVPSHLQPTKSKHGVAPIPEETLNPESDDSEEEYEDALTDDEEFDRHFSPVRHVLEHDSSIGSASLLDTNGKRPLALSTTVSQAVGEQQSLDHDDMDVDRLAKRLDMLTSTLSPECAMADVEAVSRLASMESVMDAPPQAPEVDFFDDDDMLMELSCLEDASNSLRHELNAIDRSVSRVQGKTENSAILCHDGTSCCNGSVSLGSGTLTPMSLPKAPKSKQPVAPIPEETQYLEANDPLTVDEDFHHQHSTPVRLITMCDSSNGSTSSLDTTGSHDGTPPVGNHNGRSTGSGTFSNCDMSTLGGNDRQLFVAEPILEVDEEEEEKIDNIDDYDPCALAQAPSDIARQRRRRRSFKGAAPEVADEDELDGANCYKCETLHQTPANAAGKQRRRRRMTSVGAQSIRAILHHSNRKQRSNSRMESGSHSSFSTSKNKRGSRKSQLPLFRKSWTTRQKIEQPPNSDEFDELLDRGNNLLLDERRVKSLGGSARVVLSDDSKANQASDVGICTQTNEVSAPLRQDSLHFFSTDETEAADQSDPSVAQIQSVRVPASENRGLRSELLVDNFDEYFESIYPKIKSEFEAEFAVKKRAAPEKGLSLWGMNRTARNRTAPAALLASDANAIQMDAATQKRLKQQRMESTRARLRAREEKAVKMLRNVHGFPTGLARATFRTSDQDLPLRIWIVDNSGSMSTGDGRRFLDGSKKKSNGRGGSSFGRASQMINCTRWEELRDAVLFHAELAKDLGAPTIFRLMNDPNMALDAEGLETALPQVMGVCARRVQASNHKEKDNATLRIWSPRVWGVRFKGMDDHGFRRNSKSSFDDDEEREKSPWEGTWEVDRGAKDESDFRWVERATEDLEEVRFVMSETEPRYTTPLAEHMWSIYDEVTSLEHHLREDQRVAVIIATDGLPTDPGLFLSAMRSIQKLPIYVIVRLCTDDDEAMHFWKTLDLDLDMTVEVLDDFEEEAESAYTMNPWVNYCMPIQRIREWGYSTPLLEKLRERPLTHTELRDFCALIFGIPSSLLPHPKSDWEMFYNDIVALLERESRQWNPLTKRNRGWIDKAKMAELYGGKQERTRRRKLERLKKEHERSKKLMEKRRKWASKQKLPKAKIDRRVQALRG